MQEHPSVNTPVNEIRKIWCTKEIYAYKILVFHTVIF